MAKRNQFKKYTNKATRVAMKYNQPKLPQNIWAAELRIPLEKFEGLPEVASWFEIVKAEQEKIDA